MSKYSAGIIEFEDGNQLEVVDAEARRLILDDGCTMETMPLFTDGSCIYSDSGTYGTGSVGAGTGLSSSDFIPVRGKNSLFITMPVYADTAPPSSGIVFYDKNKQPLVNYGTNCFWNRGENDPLAKTAEVFVPRGARYFRTTWWSSDVISRHPDMPTFTYTFTSGDYSDTAITNEQPANRGMENAIRRARQLTDIKWTPLVDVPRYCSMGGSYATTNVHFLDWCESGKEYKGIPYSGSGEGASWADYYDQLNPNSDAGKWGYYQFWVGSEVSLDTFATAARYPNSIFGERASRTAVNYDASIYGNVCSSFIFYALELSGHVWPIYDFMSGDAYGKKYFNTLGVLGTTVQPNDVRLGDVFHMQSHIAMVTDIFRDVDGNVTAIEISESTPVGNASNGAKNGDNLGGMCRRKTWGLEELMDSYWTRAYTLYRYKNFTDISYTPSDFVDTGREGDRMPIVDYPCIPYLGHKARYKSGYCPTPKMLIGATGFAHLIIRKNGTQVVDKTLNGEAELVLSGTDANVFSEVGAYDAYLVDGSGDRTIACKWTVE